MKYENNVTGVQQKKCKHFVSSKQLQIFIIHQPPTELNLFYSLKIINFIFYSQHSNNKMKFPSASPLGSRAFCKLRFLALNQTGVTWTEVIAFPVF